MIIDLWRRAIPLLLDQTGQHIAAKIPPGTDEQIVHEVPNHRVCRPPLNFAKPGSMTQMCRILQKMGGSNRSCPPRRIFSQVGPQHIRACLRSEAPRAQPIAPVVAFQGIGHPVPLKVTLGPCIYKSERAADGASCRAFARLKPIDGIGEMPKQAIKGDCFLNQIVREDREQIPRRPAAPCNKSGHPAYDQKLLGVIHPGDVSMNPNRYGSGKLTGVLSVRMLLCPFHPHRMFPKLGYPREAQLTNHALMEQCGASVPHRAGQIYRHDHWLVDLDGPRARRVRHGQLHDGRPHLQTESVSEPPMQVSLGTRSCAALSAERCEPVDGVVLRHVELRHHLHRESLGSLYMNGLGRRETCFGLHTLNPGSPTHHIVTSCSKATLLSK